MKRILNFLLLILCVLGVILLIPNDYVRGAILILISVYSWILVKINPHGRVYSLSRAGVSSSLSYITVAIILTGCMIIYWLVFLFML